MSCLVLAEFAGLHESKGVTRYEPPQGRAASDQTSKTYGSREQTQPPVGPQSLGVESDIKAAATEEAEHQKKAEAKENLEIQRRLADEAKAQVWIGICTVVLLIIAGIFTFRTAKYARRAANAARGTVRTMERTSAQQMRAYVNVVEGNLVNFDADCPTMQLILKNFGQTPAHKVTVIQTAKVAERPLATSALTLNEEGTRYFGVVGPGADFHLRLAMDEFPEEQKEWIRSELSAIYWYGTVHYQDVLGRDFWTKFRVMYKQDVGVTDSEGSLVTCEEGNEAT